MTSPDPAAATKLSGAGEPVAVELLCPPGDDPNLQPQVSIVVPALNEEITIAEFVEWCKEGLRDAGVVGEILIIDSSSDRTPEIALAHGARVLRTPRRGLGRAYIDAIPYIRGDFIIMGDCDLTYDFRELGEFVARYREGYEFVMGSRWRGSIEPDAMPRLHRYFGTPVTTWIMNAIYRTGFTDIHCGMRGLTKSGLERIDLHSQSWEYASEMVLKAARQGLKIVEVPVKFYKDREGRLSHHKRAGFWSPWQAGWINLKVMLVYTPDSFLLKPGIALFLIGTLLTASLAFGGYSLGPIGFDLHWMLFGITLAVLGFSSVQIGLLARLTHRLRPGIDRAFLARLTYDRGMITAAIVTCLGVLLNVNLVWSYISEGLRLAQISYLGVFGLFLIIIGFQIFGFTLLAEMVRRTTR
jgi:glycosyltransferase involved in cell wall biosynthesis